MVHDGDTSCRGRAPELEQTFIFCVVAVLSMYCVRFINSGGGRLIWGGGRWPLFWSVRFIQGGPISVDPLPETPVVPEKK